MSKSIKTIFIFGGLFFLAIILINYFGSQQLKKLKDAPLAEKFSQFQSLTEEIKATYEDFTSPDGRLKVQYPLNWIEIKNEEILGKTVSPEWAEKYNLKTLFLAREPAITNAAQLVIDTGSSNKEKTTEEIIKDMQESNAQQGWNMEIIKLEKTGKTEGIFNALYQKPNSQSFYSKEKILVAQQNEGQTIIYFIALLYPDNPAKNLELDRESDFIINSAQLTAALTK